MALFLIGIAAVIGGLIMLTTGVRGIRGRLQEIRQTYGGQPARPRQRYVSMDPFDDQPVPFVQILLERGVSHVGAEGLEKRGGILGESRDRQQEGDT